MKEAQDIAILVLIYSGSFTLLAMGTSMLMEYLISLKRMEINRELDLAYVKVNKDVVTPI